MINVHDDHNARMTDINVRNCTFEFHHKAIFAILSEKIPLIRWYILAIRIVSVLYAFIARVNSCNKGIKHRYKMR